MGLLVEVEGIDGAIDADQYDLDELRDDLEKSFHSFFVHFWSANSAAPFIDGWPIEAICEHLEAVSYGDIKRLIINIPPRCSKSSLVSVAFPAWVWTQKPWFTAPTCGVGTQFLHASYGQTLALRDSNYCRRLIQSPEYKRLWGDEVILRDDQNTKVRFENTKSGARIATSVGSAITGHGGNIIIVDDPNNAQEAFSEAKIIETTEWWDSALSTRLNDQKEGAFIVIQQRLSEQDLTGHILSKDVGEWTHLCLPMRYEPERSFQTVIGWEDPRVEPGQLLWPERFGEREVDLLERQLGPWAAAGQLQQRPEPKGGGVIKREWWQLWERESFPNCDYIVASLDTAYTTKQENDLSAMTVWGIFSGGDSKAIANRMMAPDGEMISVIKRTYTEEHPKVMLMYAWQERLELHELVLKVQSTMKQFRIDKLLIENKAAGHSVAQEIKRLYGHEDFGVQLVDPKGMDKLSRLYSVQHLFAEGLIYAPDRSWADMVITQTGTFPKAKHDDLVDTLAMALRHLRDTGLIIRGAEHTADVEDRMKHLGAAPSPLYSV
jgi:predicted phage terminase large subunit-like protein